MNTKEVAGQFVIYYDNKLIPTFEKWIKYRHIDAEKADQVFTKVCEMIYGIRPNEDTGNR